MITGRTYLEVEAPADGRDRPLRARRVAGRRRRRAATTVCCCLNFEPKRSKLRNVL